MGHFNNPSENHYDYVRKFGRNPDVDTTTDPETIWEVGGVYTGWVSAAATTTIVSDSVEDDVLTAGEIAGTGALTVRVEGVDANHKHIIETVSMNGTAAVTLGTDLLRCFRAYVVTAGTGGTNAGNIQVKHGSTVLAQITAGDGQTMQALYTTPKTDRNGLTYTGAFLLGYAATLIKNTNTAVEMEILFRPDGGAWRVLESFGMVQAGTSSLQVLFPEPISIGTGTDIEMRCLETSSNDASISAQFDVVLTR